MRFALDTFDAHTIRDNPTTQIAIRVEGWPGNTFLLWLPEDVEPGLWNNWTADVARQLRVTTATASDYLRWLREVNLVSLQEGRYQLASPKYQRNIPRLTNIVNVMFSSR